MPRRITPDLTIGGRIRSRRQIHRWSVRHAADRAGVSPSTWSRIERGLRSVDNRFLLADIASALGCSVADLAGHPAATTDPAIAAADSTLASVRRALVEAAPDEAPQRPAPPIELLQQRIDLIRDLYRRCDYAGAVKLVGDAVLDLHAAAAGQHWRTALGLSVQTYLVTMAMLKHLGYPAESWLAAERGREAAQRLDQPVPLAVAEFGRSCAATACDGYQRAHTLAVRGVDALDNHSGEPMALVARGLLTLRVAFSAAGVKRVDEARDGFAEARRIAERTGETRAWDMFFGPTNVDVWRVGVETDLGRPGRAVEISHGVNPAVFEAPVRQSMFYLDAARALGQTRKDRDAVRMLLAAERAAPQRLRSSVLATQTAQALLDRVAQRADAVALRGFLERAGLAA